MQALDARVQYRNSFHCAYRIFTEEGIRRFWTGTTPRLTRLVVCILFHNFTAHNLILEIAERWNCLYNLWKYHQNYRRPWIRLESTCKPYQIRRDFRSSHRSVSIIKYTCSLLSLNLHTHHLHLIRVLYKTMKISMRRDINLIFNRVNLSFPFKSAVASSAYYFRSLISWCQSVDLLLHPFGRHGRGCPGVQAAPLRLSERSAYLHLQIESVRRGYTGRSWLFSSQ